MPLRARGPLGTFSTHEGEHPSRSGVASRYLSMIERSVPVPRVAISAVLLLAGLALLAVHQSLQLAADRPPAFSLQQLIAERHPNCASPTPVGQCFTDTQSIASSAVSFVAVARAGSDFVQETLKASDPSMGFVHHCHDCRLADLEQLGARKVVLVLREPASRIFSGLHRRAEAHGGNKEANIQFMRHFHGPGMANDYIDALRNQSHPLHSAAMAVTVGPRRQSYMLPVNEFYLAGSAGQATIKFLCLTSLTASLSDALTGWGLKPPQPAENRHASTVALQPFTPANVRWIRDTYRADSELYERECVGQ